MAYSDLIRELKSGEPRPERAARVLTLMGWGSIGGAFWNLVVPFLSPLDLEGSPLNLPDHFPYSAFGILILVGALFLMAGRNIRQGNPVGIRLAQAGIVLLFLSFMAMGITMVASTGFLPADPVGRVIFGGVVVVGFGQFLFPAYHGYRYLGRLASHLAPIGEMTYGQEAPRSDAASEAEYKDALLPFGVAGTFSLAVGVLILSVMVFVNFHGMERMHVIFLPGFLVVFFGTILYNFLPSRFEKGRVLIESFTGGGSVYMFQGTWPFFRLLLYEDGLELRLAFHRFFIPYGKLVEPLEKKGWIKNELRIQTDLPGVPATARFSSGSIDRIARIIESRKAGLAGPEAAK